MLCTDRSIVETFNCVFPGFSASFFSTNALHSQYLNFYFTPPRRTSEMGILTIHLDKVTNLKDEDTMGKSDPYVKVSQLHAALKFE